MRLFTVLPVLSILLGTRASSHGSRATTPHRLDVRDPIVDACATVNTQLAFHDPQLGGTTIFGSISTCICLSGLPAFLVENTVASAAVGAVGEEVVTDFLTNLIDSLAAGLFCFFPDNSSPACVAGVTDCGFTCNDGFTADFSNPIENVCVPVCAPPAALCNGQCVQSGICPSAQIRAEKKRRWAGSSSCLEKGPGWAACGVYGGGPRAWECVHTAHDLESCGGCTIPLSPYSPIGEDCSALPGVADVACLRGECVVYRCLPGYKPAHDGHSCVRKYSQFDDGEDVSASVYGLEHVPLGGH